MIVKNDDHNTFDHVADVLARFIPGTSVQAGYRLADRIDQTGQAMVWSGHREPAELYWEQLRDSGLTMAPLEQAPSGGQATASGAGAGAGSAAPFPLSSTISPDPHRSCQT